MYSKFHKILGEMSIIIKNIIFKNLLIKKYFFVEYDNLSNINQFL